jgi:hypothetical protein
MAKNAKQPRSDHQIVTRNVVFTKNDAEGFTHYNYIYIDVYTHTLWQTYNKMIEHGHL